MAPNLSRTRNFVVRFGQSLVHESRSNVANLLTLPFRDNEKVWRLDVVPCLERTRDTDFWNGVAEVVQPRDQDALELQASGFVDRQKIAVKPPRQWNRLLIRNNASRL